MAADFALNIRGNSFSRSAGVERFNSFNGSVGVSVKVDTYKDGIFVSVGYSYSLGEGEVNVTTASQLNGNFFSLKHGLYFSGYFQV